LDIPEKMGLTIYVFFAGFWDESPDPPILRSHDY